MEENRKTVTYFYNLDDEKRQELLLDVCAGTKKSPSCFYMWMRRERKPGHLEQLYIQDAIFRIYGEKVELKELFDD